MYLFVNSFATFGDWGLLALRLGLAVIMVVHGWKKLKSMKQTAEWFESAGFAPGKFWAPVVACLEFFGGIGIAFGFITWLWALLLCGQFVAIIFWKIGKKQPFVGGWEFDLLILVALAALLALDGGAYSLDAWVRMF